LFDEITRQATERVGAVIAGVSNSTDGAEVTPMKEASLRRKGKRRA
jgi:hypothetical protein